MEPDTEEEEASERRLPIRSIGEIQDYSRPSNPFYNFDMATVEQFAREARHERLQKRFVAAHDSYRLATDVGYAVLLLRRPQVGCGSIDRTIECELLSLDAESQELAERFEQHRLPDQYDGHSWQTLPRCNMLDRCNDIAAHAGDGATYRFIQQTLSKELGEKVASQVGNTACTRFVAVVSCHYA